MSRFRLPVEGPAKGVLLEIHGGGFYMRSENAITTSLASATHHAGHAGGSTATLAETILGEGKLVIAALHDVAWSDGDLLVVGTSTGPLSRLYLGSHASKIVRNSPIPVLLLRRGHTKPG